MKSDKEKLDMCMNFLEFIEKISENNYKVFGVSNSVDEYGMNEVNFSTSYGINNEDHKHLNQIIEKAWHLKMDLSE